MKHLLLLSTVLLSAFLLSACGGDPENDKNTTNPGDGNTTEPVTVSPPKKTGQIKSYDYDGNVMTDGSIKDDGYYQKGVADSYTKDDAKKTVTDNVTGLMWQDNADAVNVIKPWLTQDNFDKCTGSHGELKDTSKCADTSGETATTYCANLSLGRYSDWRLPTAKELLSIIKLDAYRPAVDKAIFINVVNSYYWTSTPLAEEKDSAWRVSFEHGGSGWDTKSFSNYVRCVREK